MRPYLTPEEYLRRGLDKQKQNWVSLATQTKRLTDLASRRLEELEAFPEQRVGVATRGAILFIQKLRDAEHMARTTASSVGEISEGEDSVKEN